MASPTSALNSYLARSHGRLQEVVQKGIVCSDGPIHIVLGNEAADPDSCVCAIALAAALDKTLDGPLVVPMISVPRADFKLQLDRVHLLRRAGLIGGGEGPLWTPDHVSFSDELSLEKLSADSLNVHLVDHNKLSAPYASIAPCVTSITDHHADEEQYTQTVSASDRLVELGVGSCASLVAERIQALHAPLLTDPSLCTMLLGAILLDTVNLDPSAKAQKPREAPIADEMLLGPAASLLNVAATAEGRAAFFAELLGVKADTALLLRFPMEDLLRQDYKEEQLPTGGQGGGVKVGVGSVVLPLPALLSRQPSPDLAREMSAYATARGLQLLLLMSVDLPARQRYVLLHCDDQLLREEAIRLMDSLSLTPMAMDAADGGAAGLLAFEVGNYSVSRKVLMPILRGLAAPKPAL